MFNMGMQGTKWRLFSISVDLFAERGYSNVSVRDIAGAAGIKAASVYNHFASKDEILLTAYNFYDYYYSYFMPPLESLMELIGTEPPKQTLKRSLFRFDPSVQDIMDKVFLIASMQLHWDTRAQDLINKNIFYLTEKYMTEMLTRMIEMHLIEPLEIKPFVVTLTSLCHSSALRMRTKYPIDWEAWIKSVEQLYDRIVEL